MIRHAGIPDSRFLPRLAALWVVCTLGRGLPAANQNSVESRARRIIRNSGVRGGLIVHAGCTDGGLALALRTRGSYLVHGLVRRGASVSRCRAQALSAGMLGPVSFSRLGGGRLPFVANTVNLLIGEDLASIPVQEVMRVLTPGGVAYMKKPPNAAGDTRDWPARMSKPRPEAMDDWTHFLHDAGGTSVSRDTLVGPPRHMQWMSAPLWTRNHHRLASISAVVSAGGRVFYILDEGPSADMSVPGKWFLIARDAYNGTELWRRELLAWAHTGQRFRSGPVQLPRTLVTDGDRVYATLEIGAPVSVLDAASGTTLRTYADTAGAEEIILGGDFLLVVAGRPAAEQMAVDPARRGKTPYPNKKAVVAVRTETGETAWRRPEQEGAGFMPLTLAADERQALVQDGNGIVCLDLRTGEERWNTADAEAADAGGRPNAGSRKSKGRPAGWSVATLVIYDDVVLWAGGARLRALSADNGETLWECPSRAGFRSPADVLLTAGLVWLGPHFDKGRDPRTGEIKKTNSAAKDIWTVGHHHRCYREKATPRYILSGQRGIEFLDLVRGQHVRNNWIRGVCQYGIMPANGLIYAPAHACGCYMEAKLYGFWALAPARQTPRRPAGPRLSRGPAYGTVAATTEGLADDSSDWPTYRHDILRSGSTPMALPPALKPAWQTDLGGRPGAPVVADGQVVAAVADQHRVVALDATNGSLRWQVTTGGRVDSPPTIHRGRVIFGCADGWVRCLRAADGEEVWRFRAAPVDSRTVVLDQLESVWPVHGSVLVKDDVAYVAAGRSSFLDGGIRLYGLDPATGEILCEATICTPPATIRSRPRTGAGVGMHRKDFVQNATDQKTFADPDTSDAFSMGGTTTDVWVSDGHSLFLRQLGFTPELVPRQTKSRHLFSTSRLLDDAENHRSHWVLGTGDFSRTPVAYPWIANSAGGRYGSRLAVPYGLMLAFDETTVWGVRRLGGYTLYAAKNRPFAADETPQPDFRPSPGQTPPVRTWAGTLGMRPRAMLKAGQLLVVGGIPPATDARDPYARYEGRAPGRIWTIGARKGTKLSECALDTPPVWDGLAAANGKLYVATEGGRIVCLERDPQANVAPTALPPVRRTRSGRAARGPEGTPGKLVEPDSAGKLVLAPSTAKTSGRLTYQPDRNNLGAWIDPADTCTWNLRIEKAGTYAVEFTYGSTNPAVEYTIRAGNKSLNGTTRHTGGIKTYKSFQVGTLELPAGRVALTILPGAFQGAIMNFRRLTLAPVQNRAP